MRKELYLNKEKSQPLADALLRSHRRAGLDPPCDSPVTTALRTVSLKGFEDRMLVQRYNHNLDDILRPAKGHVLLGLILGTEMSDQSGLSLA